MKKLSLERMEGIQGGDCFSALYMAVDAANGCYFNDSGVSCIVLGIAAFEIASTCF